MSEVDPIYKELAAKIGAGESKHMPRILERLTNLEQASIVHALPDPDRDASAGRSLEVSEQFVKKLNLDKEVVDRHIQELFEKGLLFPTRQGPQMARSIIQLRDASLGNPKYDESLGKEFFDLWGQIDGGKLEKPKPEDLETGFSAFRIVPRWRSIKDVPGVLPHEDIREILKEQELLVLVHCPCKRAHRERECNIPVEVCINLGRTAQYNIERGAARKINYEEALELIKQMDEHPVVHCTINQKNVTQLVCNCHWDCCPALKSAAKSRFDADVDPEKCRACKTCVDRCQFGAIGMKYYPELGEERTYTDPELCRGCGCCVITCPAEARTMKVVRPPEHIPDARTVY